MMAPRNCLRRLRCIVSELEKAEIIDCIVICCTLASIIDLVDLDLAIERDVRRLIDNALAQLGDHAVDIVLVQTQFLGDLPVGQI